MQFVQKVFSHREKRQATNKAPTALVADLKTFRETNGAYLEFIDRLREQFTEPGEKYGQIKVTKRKEGNTKVTIRDGTREVSFIYKNADVYIIGIVVGDRFYLGKDYKFSGGTELIGRAVTERLTNDFSYGNIMQEGVLTQLDMGALSKSLQKLTEIGDRNKRIEALRDHLAPFVVAFAEAVRYDVIAKAIQNAIIKRPANHPEAQVLSQVKLCTNVMKPLGIGHPSHRDACSDDPKNFSMFSAMLNWGKLSESIPDVYKPNGVGAKVIQQKQHTFAFGKSQLNLLLTLANSQGFEKFTVPGRNRRHLSHTAVYGSLKPQPALLENNIKLIANDDNISGSKSSTTHVDSIAYSSPDVLGALQLLTLGVLYLSGRKLNFSVGGGSHDPLQAQAIAVDLVDRIKCFLDSSSSSSDSLHYEEAMELQRAVASGLVQGDPVDRMVIEFIGQKYAENRTKDEDDKGVIDLEEANKFIAKALSVSSGLSSTKEYSNVGNWCDLL